MEFLNKIISNCSQYIPYHFGGITKRYNSDLVFNNVSTVHNEHFHLQTFLVFLWILKRWSAFSRIMYYFRYLNRTWRQKSFERQNIFQLPELRIDKDIKFTVKDITLGIKLYFWVKEIRFWSLELTNFRPVLILNRKDMSPDAPCFGTKGKVTYISV